MEMNTKFIYPHGQPTVNSSWRLNIPVKDYS